MTEADYVSGWTVYTVGVALVILVGWRITQGLTLVVRVPLLLLLTAFLLTPFNIESGSAFMGPAWLIMLYEGVFLPEIGFSRVGPAFGMVILFSVVIFPIFYLPYALIRKPKATQSEHNEQPQQAEQQTKQQTKQQRKPKRSKAVEA